ncbi:MAG TPA: hypothetical protein ENN97_01505 [Phycisphaerales bacterium]|nr:hypothetical protein [Phycisphaerales bacterium]
MFFTGLQNTGDILVFRLPIVSSTTSTEVTYIKTIASHNGVRDISALHYNAEQGVLYATYDDANLLRAIKPDGTVLREWHLPGKDQEGLTFKEDAMYLSKDFGSKGGDVFYYKPFFGIDQPIVTTD